MKQAKNGPFQRPAQCSKRAGFPVKGRDNILKVFINITKPKTNHRDTHKTRKPLFPPHSNIEKPILGKQFWKSLIVPKTQKKHLSVRKTFFSKTTKVHCVTYEGHNPKRATVLLSNKLINN